METNVENDENGTQLISNFLSLFFLEFEKGFFANENIFYAVMDSSIYKVHFFLLLRTEISANIRLTCLSRRFSGFLSVQIAPAICYQQKP